MMKTMSGYELMVMVARHKNMPQIIETFLAQMAVLFVSYSMISTGLLTAFIWDTLVFDKRDAMVLGPLPLRGSHDRRREARRARDVSHRDSARRERHIGCVVRVSHRRHRRPHPSAPRRTLVGNDWRRGLHVLHAGRRPRIARAARQRARRRDRRVVAAVRVPQRGALLHDGADGDRSGAAADLVVRRAVRDDSRISPAGDCPLSRRTALIVLPLSIAGAIAVTVRRLLEADACGAGAVGSRRRDRARAPASSLRSSPDAIVSRARRPISC